MFPIGIWNPDAIKIVMENLFRFFFFLQHFKMECLRKSKNQGTGSWSVCHSIYTHSICRILLYWPYNPIYVGLVLSIFLVQFTWFVFIFEERFGLCPDLIILVLLNHMAVKVKINSNQKLLEFNITNAFVNSLVKTLIVTWALQLTWTIL